MHTGLDYYQYRTLELSQPRYQEKLRLVRHGYKVHSQSDEDGIIAEIFKRIGTKNKTFVEFGVEHGIECNTLWLLMQGWSGLWIDGGASNCKRIAKTHAHYINGGQLRVENAFITNDNINDLLGRNFSAPGAAEIDLLSIDIDFNDYWVWMAIVDVKPRVVVIEYNASWPPPANITVPYAPQGRWNGTSYFGASLGALAKLGARKGYSLVGCCLSGTNAFFVRDDLVKSKFFNPGSAEEHYEPPRYFLSHMPSGHKPGVGPLVTV